MKIENVINIFFGRHSFFNNNITYKNSTNNFKLICMNDKYLIYSYNELIGERDLITGHILIHGKTAKFNNFYSQTTSTHIGKIINYCDMYNINYQIIQP